MNNIEKNFDKIHCEYFIKKNGKIIYIPNIYKIYLCLIKNIKSIDLVKFPYLYGINENDILKKLKILYILQKKDYKYIKTDDKLDKGKNYNIFIFEENKKNIMLETFFLSYITNNSDEIYHKFYGTILRELTTRFMINKLIYNKTTDKKILIMCFYSSYIKLIKEEIYKKYKKQYTDFKNYSELYIFLKKHGYVDKYYNYYAYKMIKNYNKVYKEILKNPELEIFKAQYDKKIKNFNKINLIKIIDKYVNNNFNKEHIKNKFIEFTKSKEWS
jgi:hypothetical protein